MTYSLKALFDLSTVPTISICVPHQAVEAKGNNPYIFVSASDIPVSDDLLGRLEDRLRKYGFDSIYESSKSGRSGYFVVFSDSAEGQDAASKCYKSCNGTPFWGHSLRMKKFDSGFSFLDVRKGSEQDESSKQATIIKKEYDEARGFVPPFRPPQANMLSTSSNSEVQNPKISERSSSLTSVPGWPTRNSSTGKRDAGGLNRRRLEDDDSRSLSSTSSLKRSLKCHVCHQAEGFSYNAMVTCSCHRRFHRTCHKPMITLAQQSDSSWRCYVCNLLPHSRTLQPSSDSYLEPPAKRPRLMSSKRHQEFSVIKKRNNDVSALTSDNILVDTVVPRDDVFVKPEADSTRANTLTPLLELQTGLGATEELKTSFGWNKNENMSDSASMDISLDNVGSTDIESTPNDTALFEDSVSMDISTTCDESSDHEMVKFGEGRLPEGSLSTISTLPEHQMKVDCPLIDQQLFTLDGAAECTTRKRRLTLVNFDKETGLPRLISNRDKLPEDVHQSAELVPMEGSTHIEGDSQEPHTKMAAPGHKSAKIFQSTSVEFKDISSATSCSEAVNTGSSFRGRSTSQSSLSSPPSEMELQELPSSLEKPKGNYVQYITAALEAAPSGILSSLEICNSIIATYPFYDLHFPRSTLTNSVSATLSQRPEFAKNSRPEGDNGKGYLWSLSKTSKTSSDASRRNSSATLASSTGAYKITLSVNTPKSKVKTESQTPKQKELSRSPQKNQGPLPIAEKHYAVKDNGLPTARIVVPTHHHGITPEWCELDLIAVMAQGKFRYRVGDTISVQTDEQNLLVEAFGLIREMREFNEDEIFLAIAWYYTKDEMTKSTSSRNQLMWPEGATKILTNWLEVIPSSTVVRKVKDAELSRCHSIDSILDVKGRPNKIRSSDDARVSWIIALDEMIGQRYTDMTSSSFSSSQAIPERAEKLAKNKRTPSMIKQLYPNDSNEQTRETKLMKKQRNGNSSAVSSIDRVSTISKALKKDSPSQGSEEIDNEKIHAALQSTETVGMINEPRTTAARKHPGEEEEVTIPRTTTHVQDQRHATGDGDKDHQPVADPCDNDPATTVEFAQVQPIARGQSPEFTGPTREELLKEIQTLKLDRQRRIEAELNWTKESPSYWSLEPRPVHTPPPPNALHLQSQKKATFGRVLPLYPEEDEAEAEEEDDMETILHEGHLAFRAKNPTGSEDISDKVHVVWSGPMDFEWNYVKKSSRA